MIRRSLPMFAAFILAAVLFAAPVDARAADANSVAGAVTVSSWRLNVRQQPNTDSAIVSHVYKGSYVTLLSRSGNWWQVEYGDGQTGWCHSDYITPVEGRPVTVQTGWGNLNVRSGPGTGYTQVDTLPKGKTVLLLSQNNGWSRILYHGTKTGYVSSQYLSGSASAGYGAVSLSVPSYKQTDSRWANVTLGSSGQTIGKIGCATTAIAMMESYRTGSTVTPDTMSRRLSYTASGSVYWPGHYTVVTSSDLSGIYKLLQQGKPVLYGAKNNYGGQHWVVIAGYTGGSTLTAAGFTVHDPGSNSRTTLQQFLSAYPHFYKYFHY